MGQCSCCRRRRSDEELGLEIIELQKKALVRDYPDPKDTVRDAHPKTLGLLKGEFRVNKDLAEEFKVGIFADPKTYPCWVRYSSANPTAQSDLIADKRGCAIKLLSPESETEFGQDYVLMNTPIMPLGTPQLFRDMIYWAQISFYLLAVKLFFEGKLGKFLKFLSFRTKSDSILGERFHSTTPYAFGETNVVKYGLFPAAYNGPSMPERVGYNYLTDEMQKHFDSSDATFDFCIQLQKDVKKMPIEDASVLWDEKLSPFIKMATLYIPAQSFANSDRFEMAERLAFDLGRCLPEHKPLGGLNKVRTMVYSAISKFRHERAGRLV